MTQDMLHLPPLVSLQYVQLSVSDSSDIAREVEVLERIAVLAPRVPVCIYDRLHDVVAHLGTPATMLLHWASGSSANRGLTYETPRSW